MNSPLDWPEQGNNLNNYNTMFIQSLTLPTLFPYASGNTDFNLLSQLSEDGSVKGEVNVIKEEE
eukprot:4849121-Ditylum_brightwellii.AAC.1